MDRCTDREDGFLSAALKDVCCPVRILRLFLTSHTAAAAAAVLLPVDPHASHNTAVRACSNSELAAENPVDVTQTVKHFK